MVLSQAPCIASPTAYKPLPWLMPQFRQVSNQTTSPEILLSATHCNANHSYSLPFNLFFIASTRPETVFTLFSFSSECKLHDSIAFVCFFFFFLVSIYSTSKQFLMLSPIKMCCMMNEVGDVPDDHNENHQSLNPPHLDLWWAHMPEECTPWILALIPLWKPGELTCIVCLW